VSGLRLARNHAAEPAVHAAMRTAGWPEWSPLPQVYSGHGFEALVGREHCGGLPSSPLRWHISVRGPDRVPTWGEMVDIAHSIRPGVPFVIGVPPRSLWLNMHPHVLHLWETGDDALLEEWRTNARGDTPS
jgi:hypothetical protein